MKFEVEIQVKVWKSGEPETGLVVLVSLDKPFDKAGVEQAGAAIQRGAYSGFKRVLKEVENGSR